MSSVSDSLLAERNSQLLLVLCTLRCGNVFKNEQTYFFFHMYSASNVRRSRPPMSLCSAFQNTQYSPVPVYKSDQVGKKHKDLTNFWLHDVRPIERESCISENVQNDEVQNSIEYV